MSDYREHELKTWPSYDECQGDAGSEQPKVTLMNMPDEVTDLILKGEQAELGEQPTCQEVD